MKYKISIVLPTYNRAHQLVCALHLYATNQTMPKRDFEIIVMDDGSDDDTYEVCRQYGDALNLRYFYSNRKEDWATKYGSPYAMLNFAAKHAMQSNLLLFSDPEGLPMPRFVEEMYLCSFPGYYVHEPKWWATGIPGRNENPNVEKGLPHYIRDDTEYLVMALCTKSWHEHEKVFGSWKEWADSGKLKDIESFWDTYWNKVMSLPKDYVDHSDFGYGYRGGTQAFWGNYALMVKRDFYIKIGGFEESIERPGSWVGGDAEFRHRLKKILIRWI